jgi:chromosome segregation ATPase
MHTFARLSAILATLLLVAVPSIEAQQMRGGGPGGMMSALVDPVEVALENSAELGLTAEQVAQLEAYRVLSLERTADAREVAAPMIERMRQMRENAGEMRERRGEMQERRAGMQERRGEIRERRAEMQEQRAEMQERRDEMRERRGEMQERGGEMRERRSEMQEHRGEMQERRAEMQERRSEMQEHRGAMQERRLEMQERRGQAPQVRRGGTGMDADMRAAIETLRSEHARSRGELERLLTTEQVGRLHALVQPRPMRSMGARSGAR